MRSLFFLSLFTGLTSICAFAQEKQSSDNCRKILRNPLPLYETFDHDGPSNIGVRADLLYMIYNAPALTYAAEQESAPAFFHSHVLNTPGHLSLGCNLAVTYTMRNQPGYSFESSWYHIVAKFSRSVTAESILPSHILSLNNGAPGTAAVNGHMAINFFDLLIKKQFSFGDWFFMTPAIGLVGGYVNGRNGVQAVATGGSFSTITAVTAASLFYRTQFEGIGFKLGGNTAFRIGMGFKLQAELSYSVLYGFAKAYLDYAQNAIFPPLPFNASAARVDYSQHNALPFFDSLLGLVWETTFRNDTLFLDLHAGWRFQTFFDGWKQFEVQTNDSVHDLALQGQGLQVGATFKF